MPWKYCDLLGRKQKLVQAKETFINTVQNITHNIF